MAVLHKAHKSNFTVIDNAVFKSSLSLKARGLLCTMLSLPDNWHFSTTGLSAILPSDGESLIRSAIKELETNGYLTRERIRDDKGKIIDWLWTFSDYPQVENPHVENQHVANPHVENQRQLNTKQENTDEEKKKESSTDGYEAAPSKRVPEKKRIYGTYRNVKLSDTDLSKLKDEFPGDWQERIDRLSTYMDNWARRDSERQKPSRNSDSRASEQDGQGKRIADMTIEEIMEKYNVDYMTAQEMAFDMC